MGLFDKLFTGLSKTRNNLDELEELFRGYAPDSEDFYDELEELLVLSDVGLPTAEAVVKGMRKLTWERRFRKGHEAREGLIELLSKMLQTGESSLKLDTKPSVILMVGVNGVGKTTTIGKLASQLKAEGKRSCSARATPSARPRPSSWRSGRSAPERRSSATRRAAIPAPWSTMRSARRRPAGAT